MTQPLVSVICLCYNHAKYLEPSIISVVNQCYDNLEIIIVDDASTDGSQIIIERLLNKGIKATYCPQNTNLGNCRAFNKGLALAKGEYVVDHATDDIMESERIAKQVTRFEELGKEYGVVYTNASYINESGVVYRDHADNLKKHGLISVMPEGDVFAQVLAKYFISSPTVMFRMEVIQKLNGYDGTLAYEDFDFWVRSSRDYKYGYIDEPLTRIRKVKGSLSSTWYKPGDKQLKSTYMVCEKAFKLVRNEEERDGLATRLKFELRTAIFSQNFEEAALFYHLLKKMKRQTLFYSFLNFLGRLKPPLSPLRDAYQYFRYGK